jgi:hypothetical protein
LMLPSCGKNGPCPAILTKSLAMASVSRPDTPSLCTTLGRETQIEIGLESLSHCRVAIGPTWLQPAWFPRHNNPNYARWPLSSSRNQSQRTLVPRAFPRLRHTPTAPRRTVVSLVSVCWHCSIPVCWHY